MLMEDAVAMEIDLAVVRGLKKSIALFWENASYATNGR
jgi:hypothetical protein